MSDTSDPALRSTIPAGSRFCKRAFDIAFALGVLIFLGPVMVLTVIAATLDTRQWGVFSQIRIGRQGRPFRVYKIRSMRTPTAGGTTVTTARDPRITPLGALLRRTKLDELPQFVNVLLGHMSVVGPRPDVPGFADQLTGNARIVLTVRPGITGPATVYFRDEEQLLANVDDPEHYNQHVLWPAKVRINTEYVRQYSLLEDIRLVIDTAWSRPALSRAAKARLGQVDAPEFAEAPTPV
ncbi:MAG: sugar transferase [Gammaproteobacteria bacterium]|nr:sugar transferase [Gammaproteobacteria bacterium]